MCASLNLVAEITRNPIKITTMPDDAFVRSIVNFSDRVIVISDTPDIPIIINTTPTNIIIKPTNRPIKAFVDSYKYTSWKDGILIFRNESFESLSKKIERWYDVNISFANEELKELHFTGVIREGKTIEHILNLIKSTSQVSFTINEQNVLLNKKGNQ